MDMSKPAGLRHRFFHPRPSLTDVTQACQDQSEGSEHRRVGIEGQFYAGAMRRISEACASFQKHAGGNELPEKEAASTMQQVAQQLRYNIVSRDAACFERLG